MNGSTVNVKRSKLLPGVGNSLPEDAEYVFVPPPRAEVTHQAQANVTNRKEATTLEPVRAGSQGLCGKRQCSPTPDGLKADEAVGARLTKPFWSEDMCGDIASASEVGKWMNGEWPWV